VRKVFVDWYRAGLIYRGNRLVNWDPALGTAVSDLEVDNVERDGSMWSIRYLTTDGAESVVVATTRPETMLGDVAVAVHPQDERYAHLIGQQLHLPLTGREIPVIADDYVDREFGTGCVKITPAHDFNDYAIGQRHQLAPITIFTLDAKVNERGPEKYRGLDRYDARKAILADLEAAGLLVETKPHKLKVPVSQRSGAVIEPMLTDQWFVDLTSDTLRDGRPGGRKAITEPALQAVTSGAITFVPENWSTTYTQWLENIQDWCISRQLWWGHRIPAWYHGMDIFVGESAEDALGYEIDRLRNFIASRTADGVQPADESEQAWTAALNRKLESLEQLAQHPHQLTQDEDVLDTWFSSALWPFSTMGWPQTDSPVVIDGKPVADWRSDQAFLPSAVLVTGFDIIFFWVARMVMATTYFVGRNPDGTYTPERLALKDRVPFREVYINAIVRDAEGQKMSKSKGNTIDPLDLIDGIGLEDLVQKSTASLLIPQVRAKVEKRIRKDYPDGIKAVGTDALRFTFAALATHGRTINFDLKRAEGYRNFCNKLWNAARFVLMNTEGFQASGEPPLATAAEKWIYVRFWDDMRSVEENFAAYRFDLLAQDLYRFVWNDYCDWFVELAKLALNGNDAAAARSTRHTLLYILEGILRALHPITPFVTEEIWQEVAPRLGLTRASILERPYPCIEPHPEQLSGTALEDFQAHTRRYPPESTQINTLIIAVSEVRSLRSQLGVSPARAVPLLIEGSMDDPGMFGGVATMLQALCRIERIDVLPADATPPPSAAAPLFGAVVHIPLAGLIDLDAERARVAKELKRIEGEIAKCQAKLGGATFVANAPAAVVALERQRLTDWSAQLAALREQAARLGG
ncbi:MAG: valine--tRNA ligase, partial [Xanthomonadaceae bacterium]|nr:valine--tRNA ligase [Xanthomonadaceae bacterium]